MDQEVKVLRMVATFALARGAAQPLLVQRDRIAVELPWMYLIDAAPPSSAQ